MSIAKGLTKAQWEQMVYDDILSNRKLLDACGRHFWPTVEIKVGATCVCTNCGGRMLVVEAAESYGVIGPLAATLTMFYRDTNNEKVIRNPRFACVVPVFVLAWCR